MEILSNKNGKYKLIIMYFIALQNADATYKIIDKKGTLRGN